MAVETLRITFTGRDGPGITAAIAEVLSAKGAQLFDVEQVVVQGFLTLGFAVGFAGKEEEEDALKELLFVARKQGLQMEFAAPLDTRTIELQRFALTAIAQSLGTGALRDIATTLAAHGANIERIHRLSAAGLACVELSLSLPPAADSSALKRALLAVASAGAFDVALQEESLLRRSKRLVVMDMDSTLIQIEVIDELASAYGVGEQVAAITRRAMQGELDFDQSLRERVALLRGMEVSVLDRLATDLPLTEGAEVLLRVLKRLGYRTAVISGGFSVAAQALRERLGIDFAWSNTLEVEGGKLTGRVVGPIVNAERKAELLEEVAQREGIPLDQVIAIGDGANDLLMLQKAGHGIAFHAKPKLREAAHTAISGAGLDAILYLLGIGWRDIASLEKLDPELGSLNAARRSRSDPPPRHA